MGRILLSPLNIGGSEFQRHYAAKPHGKTAARPGPSFRNKCFQSNSCALSSTLRVHFIFLILSQIYFYLVSPAQNKFNPPSIYELLILLNTVVDNVPKDSFVLLFPELFPEMRELLTPSLHWVITSECGSGVYF